MAGLTIEDPVKFEQAIYSPNVIPGDVLELRGGTYTGGWLCNLTGTAENPIIIRPYNGERVIVDGSLTINGAYTHWYDIEFTFSGWTTRQSSETGSTPTDIPYENWINIYAPGCKLINCLIYDMTGGPGFWTSAIGGELYGCVIWNNGWAAPDRGHGHSFYTQNQTGTKTIKDCIALNAFSTGLKIYAQTGWAQGYAIIGNTIFDSGIVYGLGGRTMNFWAEDPNGGTGYLFDANMGYHQSGDAVELGLFNYIYGVTLTDNYFQEGIVKNCEVVVETGNYYGTDTGNQVFLRVNDYDANRANLTIYNEAQAGTIAVSVPWANGTTVNARNVQDYFNDIQELTVSGGQITVSMTGRTVAAPIEWDAPASSFPDFGCFILEAV